MRNRFVFLSVNIGFLLAAAAPAHSAPQPTTHTAFSARFITTKRLYALTQSFDYPSESIPLTKMTTGMECVEQSGDGCDREGCATHLYFNIGGKHLEIRNLADNEKRADLTRPATMLVRIDWGDSCPQGIENSFGRSVAVEISDYNVTGFQLEEQPIQEMLSFHGHGVLTQDPVSKAISLAGFDFDPDNKQWLDLFDYSCDSHDPIFGARECHARYLEGLKRNP